MTGKTNQRRLKNYMVRTDVQLPIIAANLFFLSAVAAVIVVVLLSPLYYDLLHSDDLWVQRISGSLFLILLRRIALAMLLILILSVVHQLVLSHRFCGPLVNFGHTFDQMARGVYARKVYLRKRDFLKPEAETINRVIDGLQARDETIKRALDQMEATLARMAAGGAASETHRRIDDLKRSIGECRAMVCIDGAAAEDSAPARDDQPAL